MAKRRKAALREAEEALLEAGRITPIPGKSRGKNRKYELRKDTRETVFEAEAFPGALDHPSPTGMTYLKHIDTSETGTVWERMSNELYAMQGWPLWAKKATSDLGKSIWWQFSHYQMANGRLAYASYKTVARNLGVTYRAVQSNMQTLKKLGLIVEIQPARGHRTARFQVRSPWEVDPSSIELETNSGATETNDHDARDEQLNAHKKKLPLGVSPETKPRASSAGSSRRNKKPKDLPTPPRPLRRKAYEVETTKEALLSYLEMPSLQTEFSKALELSEVGGKFFPETGRTGRLDTAHPDGLIKWLGEELRTQEADPNDLAREILWRLTGLNRRLLATKEANEKARREWAERKVREEQAEADRKAREEKQAYDRYRAALSHQFDQRAEVFQRLANIEEKALEDNRFLEGLLNLDTSSLDQVLCNLPSKLARHAPLTLLTYYGKEITFEPPLTLDLGEVQAWWSEDSKLEELRLPAVILERWAKNFFERRDETLEELQAKSLRFQEGKDLLASYETELETFRAENLAVLALIEKSFLAYWVPSQNAEDRTPADTAELIAQNLLMQYAATDWLANLESEALKAVSELLWKFFGRGYTLSGDFENGSKVEEAFLPQWWLGDPTETHKIPRELLAAWVEHAKTRSSNG